MGGMLATKTQVKSASQVLAMEVSAMAPSLYRVGTEPRGSCRLAKHVPTELHSQPHSTSFVWFSLPLTDWCFDLVVVSDSQITSIASLFSLTTLCNHVKGLQAIQVLRAGTVLVCSWL